VYNLVVSNLITDYLSEPITIDRTRFLEYTGDFIARQLGTLSNEGITALKSWPCLVMQEGRGEERAYVARLADVAARRKDIILSLTPLRHDNIIRNADVWKLRDFLDIGQFEFNRHHWAVKDRDLIRVLADGGFTTERTDEAAFANLPLPAPSRAELIQARKIVAEWGHSAIDDFLLEAGVTGLAAGRELGSRRDRANAIVTYIVNNPGAVTAENTLLASFFHRAAFPSERSEAPLTTTTTTPEEPRGIAKSDAPVTTRSSNRVFVVHGRNDDALNEVVAFLTMLGLTPIILHEQPNMGRHLLTKFIDEAELVTFAVVLMTDDDLGGSSRDELRPRARQNVILELGYFLAHLGQPRVCALISPRLETPSDFDGIVYISMASRERWQHELRRELEAADMPLRPSGAI